MSAEDFWGGLAVVVFCVAAVVLLTVGAVLYAHAIVWIWNAS